MTKCSPKAGTSLLAVNLITQFQKDESVIQTGHVVIAVIAIGGYAMSLPAFGKSAGLPVGI